jgi:hypothetical protein
LTIFVMYPGARANSKPKHLELIEWRVRLMLMPDMQSPTGASPDVVVEFIAPPFVEEEDGPIGLR